MSTVSNVSASNVLAYTANTNSAAATTGSASKAETNAAASTASPTESTIVTLSKASTPAPQTYNASGVVNSNKTSDIQQAQAAVLAAQNSISNALSSITGSASSGSDATAALALPGNSNQTQDSSGLSTSTSVISGNQTPLDAVLASQNVISNTLATLGK